MTSEQEQTVMESDNPWGPYVVTPSFRSFESRHEAIGHMAILERDFGNIDPAVVFVGADEQFQQVLDTLHQNEQIYTMKELSQSTLD